MRVDHSQARARRTPPVAPARSDAARRAMRTQAICVALARWGPQAWAGDTSPADELAFWSAEAGAPGRADRGRAFFGRRHGAEWSCASCHGADATEPGRHVVTGKPIPPLAPARNPRAITDRAKVDKWFRRNCGDVLGRACSAAERADVLAFLLEAGR